MSAVNHDARLFGEYLLENDLIGAMDLLEALNQQRRAERDGASRKPIGEILVELGCLSESELSAALQGFLGEDARDELSDDSTESVESTNA